MHRHFQQNLEDLKADLSTMAGVVDRQIDAAARSLLEGDPAAARSVIGRDTVVDELETRIEGRCHDLFALQQPVAADLRLVMAALKISVQLERIGDIAVNIAERAIGLDGRTALLASARIAEMLAIARIMVTDALASFARGSSSLARRVLESDDVVDNLDRTIFRRLVEVMENDGDLIRQAAHCLVLSRHIERLADHATNIAEEVIFLVEARNVRHGAYGADDASAPA
jgi:phosphate transport system protein